MIRIRFVTRSRLEKSAHLAYQRQRFFGIDLLPVTLLYQKSECEVGAQVVYQVHMFPNVQRCSRLV